MMKRILALVVTLGLSTAYGQGYEGSIKVNKWNYDDTYGIPKGISFKPSKTVDMSKTPFKKEEHRYSQALKKLHKSVRKMEAKFKKTGTYAKETIQHERLRETEKNAKKQIVWRYNIICGSSVPKLVKLNEQLRGYEKKLTMLTTDKEKAKQQTLIKQTQKQYQTIIQPLIDNVFVYREFPYDDTWDNTLYPSVNRTLYAKISRRVWKEIKKMKGVIVQNKPVDESQFQDDDVDTSGAYTKQFEGITKNFLEEHFDIEPSSKINKNLNPFKTLHARKEIELKRLDLARTQMAKSQVYRSGHKRESIQHERTREAVKQVEIQISQVFHQKLKRDYLRFEENVDQMRRSIRIIEMTSGGSKSKAEAQYKRYQKKAAVILQKMIDGVFVHEVYPQDDDSGIDSEYRNFYEVVSKLVI